ncbi:hypothetical protein DEH69_23905 [Streptomyces sp. PT12]|nr:hypothetical protein DEH69_23905 [Streptomyces sp. PT12]
MAETATSTETAKSAETAEPAGERRAGRAVGRLARRIRSFAADHGGSAEGQVSHLGARGHRLVLVGADGAWGDLVARDRAALTEAAERAGVTLHEALDGELAARMRSGPYEWSRMAGLQIGGDDGGGGAVYRARR